MPQANRQLADVAARCLLPVVIADELAAFTDVSDNSRFTWLNRRGDQAGELRQVRCSRGDLHAAIFAYNHADWYVKQVLDQARQYADAAASVGTGDCNAIQATNAVAVAAINYACGQRGLPYVWGGNGPDGGHSGFDCSGLTKAAYAAAGVTLPRTAQTQYNAGSRVPAGQPLLPGDLVFYGTPNNIHHVGLYIGGGFMVDAPDFGQVVKVEPYRYKGDDYAGATRLASSVAT
jgi:cell wall-associated NlpC family hydrolase